MGRFVNTLGTPKLNSYFASFSEKDNGSASLTPSDININTKTKMSFLLIFIKFFEILR